MIVVFYFDKFHLLDCSGDFDILVDDNGTAYIIYSQNYYMSIEQLTPDFYYSTGKSYMFEEYFVEAPIFLKKNNIYYALFGWCCCYCLQGSGVLVHTSTNPMGPYTLQVLLIFLPIENFCIGLFQSGGDLACIPNSDHSSTNGPLNALPTPKQGCQFHDGNTTSIARSQQNYIIKVANATGHMAYVWTGDR